MTGKVNYPFRFSTITIIIDPILITVRAKHVITMFCIVFWIVFYSIDSLLITARSDPVIYDFYVIFPKLTSI